MPTDPNTGLTRNLVDPKTGRPRRGRPKRFLRDEAGNLTPNPDFRDRRERLTKLRADREKEELEKAMGYPEPKYNEDPEVSIPELPGVSYPIPFDYDPKRPDSGGGYPQKLPRRPSEPKRRKR